VSRAKSAACTPQAFRVWAILGGSLAFSLGYFGSGSHKESSNDDCRNFPGGAHRENPVSRRYLALDDGSRLFRPMSLTTITTPHSSPRPGQFVR